ncbi:1-acylglycerol-3-phosphate O-acyltransferase [Pandoraea thiooxydans]|uniref:Fatty acyl-AMP ligase n=1 Tax=Pandoraea thiooxydans TaxID=445709 RepID=A0A0G3ETZ8_9BURK|nr:AMP-binding protein [Pandoraea thiooxydans]AKJ68191.1 fatty acyl-AMP ligase [Pandoraea thiooxydans]APR95492.1 1-acylglycerol-3-phosphate O-acyltransferase [Pandoraea thiooxydans]
MNPGNTETQLLATVEALAGELQGSPLAPGSVTLDTHFERDLGLDSLSRAELMNRVEQTCQVHLPIDAFAAAMTPADVLRVIATSATHAEPATSGDHPRLVPADEIDAPRDARTLVDVLLWHAERHPTRTHIVLVEDGVTATAYTYEALHRHAMRIAFGLHRYGIGPGDTVALMLPTCFEYFISFMGIMLCGAVAVPIYPPTRPSQLEEHVRRHTALLANAGVKALIASPEVVGVARLLRLNVPTIRQVLTPSAIATEAGGVLVRPRAEDTAFLQYTSGSTGDPKGVVLTHANLLANIRGMGQRVDIAVTDVLVSWLPLYHDMGLIGAWFAPMYYGLPLVVTSPMTFLARPASWLRLIDQYRGTMTTAPNFAYERCARRLKDDELRGLDLSSLRFAVCGAEPVSPDTMRAFAARFKPCGFDERALTAVYGLAENSVCLTFPLPRRGLRIDRIQRQALALAQQALPAQRDQPAVEIVGCGHPLPGSELRVVDERGLVLPERHIGRIEFRGTSATSGYYRNPAQTARLIRQGWLDTGDLGYLAEGELFITGRVKDLIIRGGRHFFPYELEEAVARVPGVLPHGVAVCGDTDPAGGTERMVILAETAETDPSRRAQIVAQINDATLKLFETPAEQVSLIPPHSVLKTSSGKIRHAATFELFRRGGDQLKVRPRWWQLASLARASLGPALRRGWQALVHALYGIYCWAILIMLGLPVWCAVVSRSDTHRNWRLAGRACRVFLRMIGIRLQTDFSAPTNPAKPPIMVANHASYLDGLILLAALPQPVNFVAKRELAEQRIAGPFLRAIGTRFVERDDYQGSLQAQALLSTQARHGDTPFFFPEGTFGRAAGLRTFRLGAFRVACATQRPIVPIALAGVRSILPDGDWVPHRGRAVLTQLAPVMPDGDDFAAALRLRDAARRAILAHCGEPSASGYGLR